MDRRDFLKIGVLAAGAAMVDPLLFSADENEKNLDENFYEQMFEGSPRGRKLAEREAELEAKNSLRAKKNQVATIQERMNQPQSSLGGESIFSYLDEKLQSAKLPSTMKKLVPYLIFQESVGRVRASSGIAHGLMQVTVGTGGRYQKGVTKEKLFDPKTNIDVGIKYLEDLYAMLQENKHYQQIKKKFNLPDDNEFIALTTINAYNSGEMHMEVAYEMMCDGEQEDLVEDYYRKHPDGGMGLYFFVANEYAYHKQGRKYQKKHKAFKGTYYVDHSPNYVLEIAYWEKCAQGAFAKERTSQTETQKTTRGFGQRLFGLLSGGVVAGAVNVVWSGMQRSRRKEKESRREFLFGSCRTEDFVKGAAVGVAGVLAGRQLWEDDGEKETQEDETSYAVSDILKKFSKELDIVHKKVMKQFDDDFGPNVKSLGFKDVPGFKFYSLQQYMGDLAFETYAKSPEKNQNYLLLAKYFYEFALALAEKAKKGHYTKPKDPDELDQRVFYCNKALEVVNDKLSYHKRTVEIKLEE